MHWSTSFQCRSNTLNNTLLTSLWKSFDFRWALQRTLDILVSVFIFCYYRYNLNTLHTKEPLRYVLKNRTGCVCVYILLYSISKNFKAFNHTNLPYSTTMIQKISMVTYQRGDAFHYTVLDGTRVMDELRGGAGVKTGEIRECEAAVRFGEGC